MNFAARGALVLASILLSLPIQRAAVGQDIYIPPGATRNTVNCSSCSNLDSPDVATNDYYLLQEEGYILPSGGQPNVTEILGADGSWAVFTQWPNGFLEENSSAGYPNQQDAPPCPECDW